MKSAIKCLIAATVVFLIPTWRVLAQSPAVPSPEYVLQGEPPPSNPWIVSLGSLLWTRTMPTGPIFVDRNTGATIVNTADVMNFGLTGGPYASIGRWLTKDWKLEAAYFGFYGFRATGSSSLDAATAPTAVLAFPDFTVGGAPALTFNPGDTQNYDYLSNLSNAEINVYNVVNSSVKVLGGFRYLNLNETFSMVLSDQFGARIGDATINTANNLFGGQIGVDYSTALFGLVQFTGIGRFGVFGADESQTTAGSFLDVTAPNPKNAPAQRSASAGQVALVGQLGFYARYPITSYLAVRAGYQMLWIDNVALAPQQITSSSWAPAGAGGINTRGAIFLNGAFIGFDLKF